MYSSEQLDILLQEAMAGLGIENDVDNNCSNNRMSNKSNRSNKGNKISLTPAQALVIAGLLGGSLSVFSVLVYANQQVSIVLTGSLKKQNNTNKQLDQIMDQLGKVPFDDVVAALGRRLNKK